MRGGPRPALEKPSMAAILDFWDIPYRQHVMGWQTSVCPVHSEDTPSFRFNLESGGYQCMACGASGGDTLALIMQREQCDFIKAKEIAATIPGEKSGSVSSSRREAVSVRRSGYRPTYRRRRG